MQRPLVRDSRFTDRVVYVLMVGPLLAHPDGAEHVRAQMVASAANYRKMAAEYAATERGEFGVGLCQGKAEACTDAAAALVLYSDFPDYTEAEL